MKAFRRATITAPSLALFFGAITMVGTALAHPFEWNRPEPTSFAAVVHLMRDELYDIQLARESGAVASIAPKASRIGTLAATVPGFALTLSSALADSAAGPILRVARRMESAAAGLQQAAERGDLADVAVQTSRCGEVLGLLDAFVPKQYVCPMHCDGGRVYDSAGLCPVCNMHLQLITSDRYTVDVHPANGPVRAGVATTLRFQLLDPAGSKVERLQIVHEKLLHLIMVSQDLSWFAHEHPVAGLAGSFELRYTFPAGGRYVLYHDFTPDSVGMQVVPVALVVAGPERPVVPLVEDDRPKRVNGYEISLSHTPLTVGADCTMTFTVARRGKPVTDLEPFLGTAGHLIMISQDHAAYVHSHPVSPDSGPRIEFQTRFGRSGLYKAWGQFQHRGRVLTVPFVVEVMAEAPSTSGGTSQAVR